MGLLLSALLTVSVAWASSFVVESQPVAERADADAIVSRVSAAGIPAHVVRRFKLGRGWEFVVLVDGLKTEAEATATAHRLAGEFQLVPQVFRLDEGAKGVPVVTPPAEEPAARTPGDWLADVVRAHGGASGGAARLSLAASVHVVYTRTAVVNEKEASIRHDYWRSASGRRLAVSTDGAAVDSLAVVSGVGGWVVAKGAVTPRDIGVLLESVDAFAPEAVLTVALEVAPLLASPEVARFQFLEGGAQGGLRLGSGSDGPEPGLAYVDIDPASGRLSHVRYVTEGGPIEWDLRGWKEVSPGVLVPFDVRIERADGRKERVLIEKFEVGVAPPSGAFDAPKG